METLAAENFIKDPYAPDFLDLKNYPALRESALRESDLELVRQVKSIVLNDSIRITLVMDGYGWCFVIIICQP